MFDGATQLVHPCFCIAEARGGSVVRHHAGTHAEIQRRLALHGAFPGALQRAAAVLFRRPGAGRGWELKPGASLAIGCRAGKHRSVAFALILRFLLLGSCPNAAVRLLHTNAQAWPRDCRLGLCTQCSRIPESLISALRSAEAMWSRALEGLPDWFR